jgi:hypothetical protein
LERRNGAESLKKEDDRLELLIISVIEEREPSSVDQLIKFVAVEGFSEEEIIKEILRLEKLRKLKLESDSLGARAFKSYLFSSSTFWYWVIMLFCLLAVVSVEAIPPDFFPFAYIRLSSLLVFLLYIPGFCLTVNLFPKKKMSSIEVTIFSISFSLILVLLVGLFWNFTPLGLSGVAITLTLTVLSAVFATRTVLKRASARAY